MNSSWKARQSGIEMLKILAMAFIIAGHIIQTFTLKNEYIYDNHIDYLLNLSQSTLDIQIFILQLSKHLTYLGNTLFFVCSAFFLLRTDSWSKRKWFRILIEVWFVSFVFLAVTLGFDIVHISKMVFVESLFPTTLLVNWYLTCYLLFYPLHGYLNILIAQLNKKSLFRICVAMAFLYFLVAYIKGGAFFYSYLILWISMYFIIAYIQLYLKDVSINVRLNILLLVVGLVGIVFPIVFFDICGMRVPFLNNKVCHLAKNNNPFILMTAIAMLNLAGKIKLKSKMINAISAQALLIYVIHENVILRRYIRPQIADWIYHNIGYERITAWIFLFALVLFLLSLLSAFVWKMIFEKFIYMISDNVCNIICNKIKKVETKFLMLH